MEEIDNIIIESLKHIKCNIDEETTSIKDFNADLVVDAVSSCLEIIDSQMQYPHKLPPSMSMRLKLATSLAEAIRELGFRGDIGYQTILYCNEVEVRRVLMFLVERLPRESDDVLPTQEIGHIEKLKRKIEENVRICLSKAWIPPSLLKFGSRECGTVYMSQSCMHMYPLHTESLHIPQTQKNKSDDLKEYWIHHLPFVTNQCSSRNLLPSLLFRDTDFKLINLENMHDNTNYVNYSIDTTDNLQLSNSKIETDKINSDCNNANKIEIIDNSDFSEVIINELQSILVIIEKNKERLSTLKEELKVNKTTLLEVVDAKTKEEMILKEYMVQYKIKSKTLAVVSNEEYLEKLKDLIQTGNDRLIELSNQWKEVQTPLLLEYGVLKLNVNNKETKQFERQTKIKDIKNKTHQLMNEFHQKEKLEKQLKEECERFSKNTGRSAYTKRILEIIANITKQNQEIQKILNDTKEVQKEINNLNGQLDRSFTLSDELIFRNAKQDEMSRKAYKLLVTLHNDCGAIIQAITELGLAERESRNLQEQIDTEASKSTGTSLERVNADLQNVRKETSALTKQVQV